MEFVAGNNFFCMFSLFAKLNEIKSAYQRVNLSYIEYLKLCKPKLRLFSTNSWSICDVILQHW